MLAGKPVIVAGAGPPPWTLTRSADLAVPFVRLFGKAPAMQEIFHITADRGYGWDQIYAAIGRGLGVEPKLVHVPTDTLVRYNKDWVGPLVGDKMWAALFDNSKVKSVAGDFTCSENLDEVLAESVAHFRKRRAAGLKGNAAIEPLLERIMTEQSALGG
jgi:nucleoside-diphosphate-sugar epimerase